MAPSAEDLAHLAAQRDAAAWNEIFRLHWSTVYTFLRYRVPSPGEAEDLAARVFEIAFDRADRFRYQGTPIEAWLIGIARNVARDYRKKAGRRGTTADIADHPNSLTPVDDPATTATLHLDLAGALETLTEDQRTVVTLRFLLDRSVAETAAFMDRSEDAVKHLQRRALSAMRRHLDPAGTGP